MYKVISRHCTNFKKRFSALQNSNSRILNWSKTFYLPDAVANLSSKITNIYPKAGKYATNVFTALLTNAFVLKFMERKDINVITHLKNLKNVLIIGDLNIGDAVNLQGVALAIKELFPQTTVSYAINKKAYSLIAPNPHIDRVFNVLSYDKNESVRAINFLINSNDYDLIINLCPFFKKSFILGKRLPPFIDYGAFSMKQIYNEMWTKKLNHISYQAFSYFYDLFSKKKNYHNSKIKDTEFTPIIYLSNNAVHNAKSFLFENNIIGNNKRLILFNPDATSLYTLIPIEIQLSILKTLSESNIVKTILLTPGHTFLGIENKLLNSLPDQSKIIPIPKDMQIDVYAALIDFCDVFITADTGTMHIAAAKKIRESGEELRNRTALFSVFGATSTRMYGYDSYSKDILKSGQNAPSKLYVSNAPCKNITCTNKKAKSCKRIRCFSGINGLEIAKDILDYLVDG